MIWFFPLRPYNLRASSDSCVVFVSSFSAFFCRKPKLFLYLFRFLFFLKPVNRASSSLRCFPQRSLLGFCSWALLILSCLFIIETSSSLRLRRFFSFFLGGNYVSFLSFLLRGAFKLFCPFTRCVRSFGCSVAFFSPCGPIFLLLFVFFFLFSFLHLSFACKKLNQILRESIWVCSGRSGTTSGFRQRQKAVSYAPVLLLIVEFVFSWYLAKGNIYLRGL